ncbi:MAG: transporter substrate-binding domain-containing protein [Phormidesmis sp.]
MKSFLTKLVLRLIEKRGAQLLLPPLFVSAFGLLTLEVTVSKLAESGLAPPGLADFALVAQAADLSDIRERGYITIGVKDNRAPLGFINPEGNLTGFEIDIAERLAETLLGDRTAIKLVPVANVDRLRVVLEDDVDIAIAALTITPARRRLINFSDPYYLDGAAFITQQAKVQTLRDLSLANIALLEGSSTVSRVRYILPGARLFGVSSYREGQALLSMGEVDAFAGDVSVLASWQTQSHMEQIGSHTSPMATNTSGQAEYRILPNIISAEPLAIAIPKGTQYSPLTSEINQALRRWYAEGWLQERAAFWGLPSESTQFINIAPPAQPPETKSTETKSTGTQPTETSHPETSPANQ